MYIVDHIYYRSSKVSTVCSVRYVPKHTAGIHRRCDRHRTLRSVRDDFNTGSGHFGKFSMGSIPVPDTSVSLVRNQYRYRTLRQVRDDINTGTSGTGMDVSTGVGTGIPTTSIPVPDTSEGSVKHNPVRGASSLRSVHQNPVPPHCDIKIRLILTRSDS